MSSDSDLLQRFLFENAGVRGELLHLDAAWQAVLERHPYPPNVRAPLGEALLSALLLSSTLKFKGSLILQVQTEGPIRTLVAQATHNRTVRGLARWHGEVPDGDLKSRFGAGRMVLTLQPERGEPYQGIVPLAVPARHEDGTRLRGAGIGAAVEAYFASSDQLPTRIWLATDAERAAGLLLQRMPSEQGDETPSEAVAERQSDAWQRAPLLADTITDDELLRLPTRDLLHRLFHEEDLRIFDPEPVSFRCNCSRARISDTLRGLGRGEVDEIIGTQGKIEVTCEFCNRVYRFDAVDAAELFSDSIIPANTGKAEH